MPICAYLNADGSGLSFHPEVSADQCVSNSGYLVMTQAELDALKQSSFPELDAAGGAAIGAAILGLWALAYGIRLAGLIGGSVSNPD